MNLHRKVTTTTSIGKPFLNTWTYIAMKKGQEYHIPQLNVPTSPKVHIVWPGAYSKQDTDIINVGLVNGTRCTVP